MTKTTNYQLNQWAKSDRIMMEDFNADNAKIDAALKANADAMPRIIHGSYTGDGETSQFIPLAAQPQVLIVTSGGRTSQGNIMYGGVVFPTVPSESVTLGETGFTARGGSANSMARANLLNTNYQYLAIYW